MDPDPRGVLPGEASGRRPPPSLNGLPENEGRGGPSDAKPIAHQVPGRQPPPLPTNTDAQGIENERAPHPKGRGFGLVYGVSATAGESPEARPKQPRPVKSKGLPKPPPAAPVSIDDFEKHWCLQAMPRFSSSNFTPDPPPPPSLAEALIKCPQQALSHDESYVSRMERWQGPDPPLPHRLPKESYHIHIFAYPKAPPPPPEQPADSFQGGFSELTPGEGEPRGDGPTTPSHRRQSMAPGASPSNRRQSALSPHPSTPSNRRQSFMPLNRRDSSPGTPIASRQPSPLPPPSVPITARETPSDTPEQPSPRTLPPPRRPSTLVPSSSSSPQPRRQSSLTPPPTTSTSTPHSASPTNRRQSTVLPTQGSPNNRRQSTLTPPSPNNRRQSTLLPPAGGRRASAYHPPPRRGSGKGAPTAERQDSLDSLSSTQSSDTRLARRRQRSLAPEPSRDPADYIYRPVLLKRLHFYGNDVASTRAAIEELRLHRLAAHGRESMLDVMPQGGGGFSAMPLPSSLSSDAPNALSHLAPPPPILTGVSDDNGARRVVGGEGEGEEETGPSEGRNRREPTGPWMEQQLWDEPNSNPSIGRHNIVPLLGYHVDIAPPGNAGEMDPHQFRVSLGVVLQFCEAGSLADRLGLRVRVGEREAMRMVEQLLGALAHLHSLGIVHRTLCASDVLLVPAGRFVNGLPLYNVKLANFGGALEVEDHSVDTLDEVNGRVLKAHTSFLALHAPHWPPLTLAPEVRSLLCPPSPDSPTYFITEPTGQGVTFRYLAALDIWSLGALAYRLLTHDAEARDVALSEAPVAALLAHVPPRYDPPLRETLGRSLANNPSERGTAEQLMADLLRLDKYLFKPPTPPITPPSAPAPAPLPTSPKRRLAAERRAEAEAKRKAEQLQLELARRPRDAKEAKNMKRRALARHRYRAYRHKVWFESLDKERQQRVLRRRAAYRQATANLRRRRWLVDMATFFHWTPTRVSDWLSAAVFKGEAGHIIRDPTLPEPSEAKAEEGEKKKGHKKKGHRKKGEAHEKGKGKGKKGAKESKGTLTKSKSHAPEASGGSITTGGTTSGTQATSTEFRMEGFLGDLRYSERLRRLLLEGKVDGRALDTVLTEALARGRATAEEIAAVAEKEKEDRERKGVMAKADYWDRVNVSRNMIVHASRELAALPPFDAMFKRMFALDHVARSAAASAARKPIEQAGQEEEKEEEGSVVGVGEEEDDGEEQLTLPDPPETTRQAEEKRAGYAAHIAAAEARLAIDQQLVGEAIVTAFDTLLPAREEGTVQAAGLVVALFRRIVVANKIERIWTQAERQVKQAMVREEMARVEALKAACSTTQYLTIQAFAVQAYSACLQLSSPVYRFLQDHTEARLGLDFRVRLDHPRIFVEIIVVDKPGELQTEHTRVVELGPLHPDTTYHLKVLTPPDTASALSNLVMRDDAYPPVVDKKDEDAPGRRAARLEDLKIELSYIVRDFHVHAHEVEFRTGMALRAPKPPPQPSARLLRSTTVLDPDGQENPREDGKEEGERSGPRNLGNLLLNNRIKPRAEDGEAAQAWESPTKGPSGASKFFPLPVHLLEVTWAPLSTVKKEGEEAEEESKAPPDKAPRYLVQRCFRDVEGRAKPSGWVHVYKGGSVACVDVVKPADVRDYCRHHGAHPGKDGGTKAKRGGDAARWESLRVSYRVCVWNEFGWSGFSPAGRVLLPLDGQTVGAEEGGESDPEDLHLDPEEFPYQLFGLEEDVLQKPEHFERPMRLPSIRLAGQRKGRGVLGRQRPALSADGKVWHAFLPVDAQALAKRRERLMRQRAQQGGR